MASIVADEIELRRGSASRVADENQRYITCTAHDLRTPLQVFRLATEHFKTHFLRGQQKQQQEAAAAADAAVLNTATNGGGDAAPSNGAARKGSASAAAVAAAAAAAAAESEEIAALLDVTMQAEAARSEERRVGKECV